MYNFPPAACIEHVVCFESACEKKNVEKTLKGVCVGASEMAKPEKKTKSKCVFLDFTEITSHHHKYACKKKVYEDKMWCVLYRIVSVFFIFLSSFKRKTTPINITYR